jgi:hypothetical protein
MANATRWLVVAMVLVLAPAACDEGGSGEGDEIDDDGEAPGGSECVLGDRAFEIVEDSIEGRTLRLTVEYAGGCSEHEFAAWWGGVSAPSDPPIVPIELQHYGKGESCSDVVRDEVAIDLTAVDGVATSSLRVQIVVGQGGTDTLLEVEYTPPEAATEVPDEALVINRQCGTISG